MELFKRIVTYMTDSFMLYFGSAYFEPLGYFVLFVCVVLLLLSLFRYRCKGGAKCF